MQESPGLKPDGLAEFKPLSRKKLSKLEVKTLGDSFLRFVCHLFCELVQH